MTTANPSTPLSKPNSRGKRYFPGEFHAELSALYPSDYLFSRKRFRQQTLVNAGVGLTLGFFLTSAIVPLFPRMVAPLAAPLCQGVVSVGKSSAHFTVGAFHQESRVLCTSTAGVSEVFTLPAAGMTLLLASVVCFALLMAVSALTKKFHEPVYR